MPDFNHTIKSMRQGELHAQLTDELTELVAAVMQQGRGGTLTLKLTVKPDRGALFIDGDIATKLPKPRVGAAMFYGDEHGNLFSRDPKQTDIDDFTKARNERQEKTGTKE